MTLTLNYDGTSLTHDVARSTVSITSAAEDGEAAMSGLVVEDPTASLELLGHRPFIVEEDTCTQPRLFTGWTTARDIGRSPEDAMITTVRRTQDVNLVDLNALFAFRLLSGTDAKRPEETWQARMNWLLASDYLTGLIEDTGYIVVNTTTMDAADYTDGTPADVLRDLMDRSAGAYTYFAFWDTVASAVGLWVGHVDDAVSDSTLRISNVVGDIDSTTTFAPDPEAKLSVTPTETYSEVVVTYAHGEKRLFRSRASTASTYIRRGTKIDRPYTGSQSTASTQAERFLDQHANEQDRITVTIIVPASKVGLLVAGQRLDVKFSHLTGYTTFTSMRCVRLTVTPTNDLATHYSMAMELLAPRVSVGGCVVMGYNGTTYTVPVGNTATAFYPYNSTLGNAGDYVYGFPATGISCYSGSSAPGNNASRPWIGVAQPCGGGWYFRNYGAAAADMPLGFCDGGQAITSYEKLWLKVVGSGTATVWLHDFGGTWANEIEVYGIDMLDPSDPTKDERVLVSTQTLAYPSNTVTVPDDGFCFHHIICTDHDGNRWGYGGFDWVSGGSADTEIVLPPTPGAPITSTSDPTVNDGAPLLVGQTWINTASGEVFVLVDNTAGAAVWVSTTSTGTVYAPTTVDYLVGTATTALSAEIVVGTTPGGELGGTWASPTVDATHSGSTHLALGSTGSTAAAGDHTHATAVGVAFVLADGHSTPFVFDDLLQNEAGDDFIYADP